MTDRLVIYLLLAGCLIFGALVWLELEPTATDPTAPEEAAKSAATAFAARRQPSARLDELLAVALARPLFSSTRRPPQSAPDDSASGSDLADIRLTGIVTEPERHIAIFAANGAKPLRLTEGEAVSGWKIESITPREVSLSGPGGTKTLEPKLDPNLVRAAESTPVANPGAGMPAQPAPAANVSPRPRVQPGAPTANTANLPNPAFLAKTPVVRPRQIRTQP